MGDSVFSREDSLEYEVMACTACSGRMVFKGGGRYVCEECGHEYYTDFGKVKKYLTENGPKNVIEISAATGVARFVVNGFVREGRLEVVPGSVDDRRRFCASCGVALEFGTLCPTCAKRKKKEIKEKDKGVYNTLMLNKDIDGEMRFAGSKDGKK